MKKITLLFCSLLVMTLLSACSSDDDIAIDTSVYPITLEELMQIGGNGFYYCNWFNTGNICLKKEHDQWFETEPAFPYHESKPGDLDSSPSPDCLRILNHYRLLVPEYFWFVDDKVYSDYSEMVYSYMGDDYKYADFPWNKEMESFFNYLYDLSDGDFYLFMRNELKIEEGNSLQMSFSNHPLRKHKDRYFKFVLEGATAQTITIRIEFDQSLFGCDGLRLIYKSTNNVPKYYRTFDSKQDAKAFVESILAKFTDE